jgi:sec-independent protein translocase protein TatB
MNFLGVGPAELIVILVVALIFVGPERLPRLAADLARTIREIRKYTGSLAAEFGEVVKDFEKDTEGERGAWKEIGEGITGATQSVTDAIRGARADASTAGSPAPPAGPPSSPPAAQPAPSEAATAEWREIGDEPPIAQPAATAASDASAPAVNGHAQNGYTPGEQPTAVPADEAR